MNLCKNTFTHTIQWWSEIDWFVFFQRKYRIFPSHRSESNHNIRRTIITFQRQPSTGTSLSNIPKLPHIPRNISISPLQCDNDIPTTCKIFHSYPWHVTMENVVSSTWNFQDDNESTPSLKYHTYETRDYPKRKPCFFRQRLMISYPNFYLNFIVYPFKIICNPVERDIRRNPEKGLRRALGNAINIFAHF